MFYYKESEVVTGTRSRWIVYDCKHHFVADACTEYMANKICEALNK